MKTLPIVLLLLGVAAAQVIPAGGGLPTSSIVGQVTTSTGGPIKNGTLTFSLSQPAIAAGTSTVVTQATACYTANSGNIVGVPDPIALPVVTANTATGTLPAGTYYVEIYYVDATSHVSALSPETTVVLSSTGKITVNAPVLQPAAAVGYGIAISTTSGAETIQGSVTGWTQFVQSTPLVAGSTPLTSNNSSCYVWFSDALIPTGTYYTVSLANKNGSLIAGFPQTWCTYGGATGTIDVSQGAPTGNCSTKGVYYPTPIMANPAGTSQSITGNLSVSGNATIGGSLTAGSVISSSVNFSIYATAGESVAHAVARLPVGGGKVIFSTGTYPSGGVIISTPNVWLEGAGMPNYNSSTAPTALTGGTIFTGPIQVIQGGDHFVIRNAGVDTGPTWTNNSNGGVATEGLVLYNNGQVVGAPQLQSPIIENVNCLGFSASAAFHCMLVENVNQAYVHNVQTVYDTHGFVLKGQFSKVDGVYARGHSTDAVILKSDNYAPTTDDTLTNIVIAPLAVTGDTKGMILQGVGSPLAKIQVSKVDISGAAGFGIQVQGASNVNTATDLTFSDITIDYLSPSPSSNYCFQYVQWVNAVNFNNVFCFNYWAGIAPNLPQSGFTNDFKLTNGHFVNIATNGIEAYGRWQIANSGFIANGTAISADANSVVSLSNNQFASNTNNLGGVGSFQSVANAGAMLCSPTAPIIASGFNVGTIGSNPNGSCSFFVTVGTGTAGSTGVLTMPASNFGWNCFAQNASRGAVIAVTTGTTTSVTLTNFGSTFTPTNWSNSDTLLISCFAR